MHHGWTDQDLEPAFLTVAGWQKTSIPACYCHLQGTGWLTLSRRPPDARRKSQLWMKITFVSGPKDSLFFPFVFQVSERGFAYPVSSSQEETRRPFYTVSLSTSNNFWMYSLTGWIDVENWKVHVLKDSQPSIEKTFVIIAMLPSHRKENKCFI